MFFAAPSLERLPVPLAVVLLPRTSPKHQKIDVNTLDEPGRRSTKICHSVRLDALRNGQTYESQGGNNLDDNEHAKCEDSVDLACIGRVDQQRRLERKTHCAQNCQHRKLSGRVSRTTYNSRNINSVTKTMRRQSRTCMKPSTGPPPFDRNTGTTIKLP